METSPVTGVKFSSLFPASQSGENKPRQLTAMDLIMKLHYIRAVYFFKGPCNLTFAELKTNMFSLLRFYYHLSGRIRIPENDPSAPAIPYIRCNDSGIRIVEANIEEYTVEKWLEVDDRSIDHRFLVYDRVLGPDLTFSPLVYLQVTKFKCGGFSFGLSWSHILGDVFSASAFLKAMGQMISGHGPPKPVKENPELTPLAHSYGQVDGEVISIRKIEPVGGYWLLTNKRKMSRFIFNLTLDQINRLMAKYTTQSQSLSEVDILYALIWKSVLNIRGEPDTNVITICDRNKSLTCSNENLVISVLERTDGKAEISELAALIANGKREENGAIKKMIEQDKASSDLIMYGANLTFVNLENVNMFEEFEIKGEKPDYVNYTVHGVGDKGVVLVFPKGKFERTLSVVMPEEELAKLKHEVNNMMSM